MPSRAKRKHQSRLTFSPLPDSSPAKAAQPESVRNRAAAVVVDGVTSSPLRRQTRLSPLPTPVASSAPVATLATTHQTRSAGKKKKSFMQRAGSTIPSSSLTSSPPFETAQLRDTLRERFPAESDSDEPVVVSARKQARKRSRQEYSDNDESSNVDTTPRATKRSIRTVVIGDEEDDEDDIVVVTPRQSQPRSTFTVHDSSEHDEPPLSSARRLTRRRRSSTHDPDDDNGDENQSSQDQQDNKSDDDAERPSPRKRSRLEEADLKEDLDFLAPSEDDDDLPRSRAGRPKTAKQRALDLLKRRRQQSSAGLSSDAPMPLAEDDSDKEAEAFEEDYQPDQDDETAQEADDWIVEADEEEQVEIPAEFRLRTAKPKELFRYVVEWCVQKKINPGFDSHDSAYSIAFSRLSTFVSGLGGSKYHSSAWTPVFSRGLLARPVLQEDYTPASALMHDRCDACNRSGHPASYTVKFAGNPYDRDSLEDFSDDEDDTGRETAIPDVDQAFLIGKTCMRNARVAHQLHHWRYHLNSWIVDYLEEQGQLSAEKIVKRDKQNTRKRGRAANKIVQQMEDQGEVKNLYRDFKNEIDKAQSGEGSGAAQFEYDSD